jgi:hypothetical protein
VRAGRAHAGGSISGICRGRVRLRPGHGSNHGVPSTMRHQDFGLSSSRSLERQPDCTRTSG